jgi:hypothetical protein
MANSLTSHEVRSFFENECVQIVFVQVLSHYLFGNEEWLASLCFALVKSLLRSYRLDRE